VATLLETKLTPAGGTHLPRQQFFCELHLFYTDLGFDAATRIDGEFAAVE
jgi:hypothetical protein